MRGSPCRHSELPQFSLLGVSHRTLPIEQRETLTRLIPNKTDFLRTLRDNCGVEEAALLSTCNRFEVVAVGEKEDCSVREYLQGSLASTLDEKSFYHLFHDDAVRHVFRVASSLDSMVIGEPQILGQVKEAYAEAAASGLVGKNLHQLFQFAFRVAKKVKRHTTIGERGVSISYVAVQLAQQIFGDLQGTNVLILGSGRMAELAALHLRSSGCEQVVVANRTVQRAVDLANRIGGSAISLHDLAPALRQAHVVIGSAQSDRPLIDKSLLEDLRRESPLFLIDLGVPRNFSVALGELDDVYLYNIDDLGEIASANRDLREEAASDADVIVEYGLFQFEKWLRKVAHQPTLLDFRAFVQSVCADELQQAFPRLTKGEPTGNQRADSVEDLAYRISQKINHRLTDMLRETHDGKLDVLHLLPLLFDDLLSLE